MAAGFPAKTSFTDGSVLPASDLNDLAGTLNKIYSTSGYPQQLSFVSTVDSVLRPIPFATSAGKVTNGTNITSGNSTTFSVTFASSARFTVNPIITVSPELTPTSAAAAISIYSIDTAGFSVRVWNVGSTTITSTNCHYHAIQMTSTSANN